MPHGTPAGLGLSPVLAFTGRGTHPLEVALATATKRPRADEARNVWAKRHGRAPNPLLLVAAYADDGGWKTLICGPAGAEPPVETGLEPSPPSEPLPPITDDDVHLVCWLAVVPST